MVVYHIRKVICRIPIGLHQHLIIQHAILEYHSPMHHISPLADPVLRYEHAYDSGFPPGESVSDLGGTQLAVAEAVVLGRLVLLTALL